MSVPPAPPASSMSNLQLRILSAIVLGSVAAAAAWYGGFPFRVLAALAGLLIYWEWQSITGYDKYGVLELAAPAAVVASMVLVLLDFSPLESIIPSIFAVMFAIAACVRRSVPYWLPFGVPYAVLPVLALTAFRSDTQSGLASVVFLLVCVWATDIFAYFAGRQFGGPKLAPEISPNKTWSGAAGGAAAAVAAGVATAYFYGQSNLVFFALAALALSIASQTGDLFESYLKRRFGVKDSGSIIPGHGGVMDRVDGLIGAVLALYLICAAMGYSASPSAALFVF
jgi:phosphatidate cytidylyltransferase